MGVTIKRRDWAGMDMIRVCLNLPRHEHKLWKLYAIEHDMTITELLVEAVTAHIKKGPKKNWLTEIQQVEKKPEE